MTLTQEQIKKLAKNLSKLNINNSKIADDLNKILKYIDLLNEIDTTWIKPTISVIQKQNKLRKDKIIKQNYIKDLLWCSNQKIISDQITISNIMK